MNVAPELEPYFNDYKLNLFEIPWLPDEQVKMFRSDFRYVADYFGYLRKHKGSDAEYEPSPFKEPRQKSRTFSVRDFFRQILQMPLSCVRSHRV